MAESDPTILPLDAALSIAPPTSTQPAAMPTNTHSAVTPTNTHSAATPTNIHSAATPTNTHPAATPTNTHPADTPTNTLPAATPTNTQPAATPTNTHPAAMPTNTHPAATPTNTHRADTPTNTLPADTPTNTHPAATPINTHPAAMPTNTHPADTPTNIHSAATPTNTHPAATPINTQPAATPINTQPAATPINTQPAATPTNTHPAATPINTHPAAMPTNTHPADTPINTNPAATPTNTQPAATPTNTHPAATPTNTSPMCQLCRCIQNEDFTQARLMVRERSQEIFDPDKRAVYNIIHYYQTYLNSRSDGLDIPKSDLWKIPSISQSETRLQLLDILRLLLQADLDPNIKTGSETPLMAAVRTHDESLILILLQHGADPNLCDGREEMNAFALSIILNDVSTVEQLLHYGSNVNAVCCGTMTPLQLSMNKSVHISKLLLQSGADIQQVLTMPSAHEVQIMVPPLIQAVGRGNIYLVSVLLEHGEDVNQTYGDHSETPLHLAVKNGDYHMVEMLIQYGAALNKLSGRGHTALGLMLTSGSAGDNRIARLLLKSGCSRRRETIISLFQRSYPPIFVACFMGNKEIVDLLIEEDESQCDASRAVCGVQNMTVSGASVQEYGCDEEKTEVEKVFAEKHLQTKSKLKRKPKSARDPETLLNCTAADGCSLVIMAALGGHYTLVKHLLHLGANPHIICCHGNLTHAAVLSSSAESLDLLELATSLGCNLNLVNEYGNTPLHLSARINVPDVCRYLVEQGALLNVRDRFGETALSASVYFGCEDNSRILIQQGADMNIADSSGTTAMYWSIFNCREPTLRLLLSAGASFTPEQFTKYPRNLKVMRNEQLVTFIQESVCQPRSLAALAVFQVRQVISRVMGGRSVKDSVLQLPVPDKVKDSVLLLNDI